MAIKESEIVPYQDLVENTLMYIATLLLGLLLGVLCEASTLLDPKVAIIVGLGILALAISGVVGVLGGWFVYWLKGGKNFNPVVGIAGVSCVPSTAKIAQHGSRRRRSVCYSYAGSDGANIAGVIVSAVACGIMISTFKFIAV